jgi:hypothetical protein
MKLLSVLAIFLFTNIAYSLEIDEKLTLRIVSTSVSKKTILINRGIEDGITKGNHAKFFVSSGVIGRAVCIKLSPTRSVWSVYRVVNAGFIREDQVMKLKVTPAVKITKDDSRMLVSDDSSTLAKDPRDLGIPLADGADDVDFSKVKMTKEEGMLEMQNVSLLSRNREIFGMIHYSSMTEKTSPDNNGQDFTNEITNMMLKIGGEWYFRGEEQWYNRFSFLASFTIDRQSLMSHLGTFVKEESSEFGFGINLYPGSMPSKTHRLIQYLNYTFSLGSTNSTYISGGEESVSNPYPDETLDGSVLSNSFAYGLKYYTPSGYGVRMEMAYTLRGDTYTSNSVNVSYLKTRVGPRFQIGLGYRF